MNYNNYGSLFSLPSPSSLQNDYNLQQMDGCFYDTFTQLGWEKNLAPVPTHHALANQLSQ